MLQPRGRESVFISEAYMKSKDSGSNRPRVLWLVGASSGIGRKSPVSAQPGNGNFQYVFTVPKNFGNGKVGSEVTL